ncbi:Disks large-associated protein 2 [Liparis tanakae]|uniref:Disks large-associated protein 2 n=1 Tax=Liparis tanakae TaxID=230148 RepID=A0A4Z2IZZ8_9TELE|nr:Disks large-associated protein 2 [Liparis tanakae]
MSIFSKSFVNGSLRGKHSGPACDVLGIVSQRPPTQSLEGTNQESRDGGLNNALWMRPAQAAAVRPTGMRRDKRTSVDSFGAQGTCSVFKISSVMGLSRGMERWCRTLCRDTVSDESAHLGFKKHQIRNKPPLASKYYGCLQLAALQMLGRQYPLTSARFSFLQFIPLQARIFLSSPSIQVGNLARKPIMRWQVLASVSEQQAVARATDVTDTCLQSASQKDAHSPRGLLSLEPPHQQYSWTPSQYFDEDSYSPPPRNMKGLSGGRPAQLHLTSPNSAHTCGLVECDHPLDHHLHHGNSRPPSYLLSPTESCPLESHHRCSPRSSIHSECMVVPVSMSATDHSMSSSTFPRMHYGSASRESGGNTSGGRDSREDGGSSSHGGSGKMNRIPANLLDQFEKQMPLHRDGFHTLQYQRTSTTTTTTEQRNESPGRIRHLVHSVQKLFTKSHSLEGSSKMNGTKGDSHRDNSHHHHHHHQGHHKHSKRSKSKERKSDGSGKQRSGGWWSSDDNLDSDSTYRTPSVMSRHPVDHNSHCYPDSMHGHLAGDLSLKTSKSNNDVKCSACESISMAPEGKFMKRSSWSTLTVSQAKEAYRKSSLNLEKPMTPTDLRPNIRPCHYLQLIFHPAKLQESSKPEQLWTLWVVPQDDWGGYPGGGKDDEIPCRRMRSSSYVKAMGDEESGESDSSPKASPQKFVRPDALVKAIIRPRELLDSQSSFRLDKVNSDMRNYITNFAADLSQSYHLQATRDMHPSIALDPSVNYNSPKFRSRNQSYMRAVSTLSQASCVSQVSQVSETEINGQFESVCESVFSEVESQAMEALDLPGCFRTRSHSYLRAIQAGYSQDDDCIPPMASTVTSTIRSTTDRNYVQEDSCLPDKASVLEDLADTAPLAHDDLGCPIRRDRLYQQDKMGATAKPLSGPPVSPSLFRSPRSSAPERPSPKAIQASIKDSATLAAAITMQWKEEVSAMRRELADLRRDLCTELRAFNNTDSSPPDLQDIPSMDLSPTEPDDMIAETLECMAEYQEFGELVEAETPDSPERSSSEQAFLWYRWQRRGQKQILMQRSGSVELWSGRYEYNRIQFCLPSTGINDRTSQQTPAITYTPNYKKGPPPVPPRTTSKPLISITAQSSTESTQDAYHEGRLPHGGIWAPDGLSLGLNPCRALYNSTDSLDSTKAVTIAMEAAGVMAGKRHPSTDSHSSVLTCDKAVLVSRAEEYLKTPRSSIGIQVEAATDSESEGKGLREYHSVGIQVEDNKKGQGRFKRSNSVTAAVQADMELEGFPTMEDKGLQFGGGFQRHSEPSTPTQYGAVRTVRTQGLFSYREDYRTAAEPASPRETTSETNWQLETPSPRKSVASPGESGRASPSLRRDGSWFMQLLHTETKRIEAWCKEMEAEAEENDLSEDTLGKIRSAVGSAQLLMSQKFQQFYWLCQQNLDPSAMPRPTSQDLAGFWDLLQLSIDDVTTKFDQLQQIKNNNWRPLDSPEKKPLAPVPKKTIRQRSLVTREKSLDLPDRGRQEARRRLMAAKRANSFRQNSASERADSIEIYIPEAQTRL